MIINIIIDIMYIYIYIYIHTHQYVYIYIYTHTHTYAVSTHLPRDGPTGGETARADTYVFGHLHLLARTYRRTTLIV